MVHIRYSRWDSRTAGFARLRFRIRSTERIHERHRRSAASDAPADAEGHQSKARSKPKGSKIFCPKWRARCASSMTSIACNRRWMRCRSNSILSSIKSARPSKRWIKRANDVQEKKQFLNDLPGKTSEAIEKLTSYPFENADAEKDFQQLVMQLEQIRKLENWLRREGSLFRGQTPVRISAVAGADGADGGSAQSGIPAFQHATEGRRQGAFWKNFSAAIPSRTSKA